MANKIKRALTDTISKEIRDELTKNKPYANVTSTIMEKVEEEVFQESVFS